MQHYVKHYEYDCHTKLELVIFIVFPKLPWGCLRLLLFYQTLCYPPFAV